MKLICCVGLCLILSAASGHAESEHPLLGAITFAQSFDLITTAVAIRSGASEANPLMANPTRAVILRVGLGAVQVAVVHRLWRSGHRTAAIVAGIGVAGAYGYIGTRNALIAAGHKNLSDKRA